MTLDAQVVLQVTTQRLGDNPGQPQLLKNGWLYLLEGSQITVLHTDSRGFALVDGGGTAPRDQWWQFNTVFKQSVGTVVKACFSRGARPVPAASLVTELFQDVRVTPSAPKAVSAQAKSGGASGSAALLNSVALRIGQIQLTDVGILVEAPVDLELWPLTFQSIVPGDPYYSQDLVQGVALWKGRTLREAEFDPNRSPAVSTAALSPSTDVPLRGLKVQGRLAATVESLEVSLVDASGNLVPLRQAATLDGGPTLTAAVDLDTFTVDVFFPPEVDGAALARSFGVCDLVLSAKAGGKSFVESIGVLLCGVELGLVDDLDTPSQGRGRTLLGGDEQAVVDFLFPHAVGSDAALQALTRRQRMHCYQIGTAFSAASPAPVCRMPAFMIELRFVGLSVAALGTLGMHRYRRETNGLDIPVFGGGKPPPADGVSRASPRTSVSFRVEWDYAFQISWQGRNDDLLPRSYGTVPLVVSGTGRADLRIDGLGGVFGPNLEQIAGDQSVPLSLAPQPNDKLDSQRRAPKLKLEQQFSFGRHRKDGAQPSLVVESLPIFRETPIPRASSVVRLLAARNQTLPPLPATVEAIRGGFGDVSLTRLVTGFGAAQSDAITLISVDAPAVERIPNPLTNDPKVVLPMRAGAQAGVVAPSGAPLSLPLVRIAGRNLRQADALALLDFMVRSVVPADGLFFLSQNCWAQTARLTVLNEAGGRMYNPGTFPHLTTISAQQVDHHVGVEAAMPIFGPPNGYGVCQLDPPADPQPDGSVARSDFGRFDRRIWDYETNIQAGIELLMRSAAAIFTRFQGGFHYTTVTRKVRNGVIGSGSPDRQQSTAARDAWVAIRETPAGRAMLQRELVRSFGGGSEFTFFAATNTWDIWSTPAPTFWAIHVDNKIHPGRVVPRSVAAGREGQGTFTPAFFGPGVSEVGVL